MFSYWHDSFIQLIKKELQRRQIKNSSYSLRKFAGELGISPSTLSELLSQKRSLGKKTAKRILETTRFAEKDREHILMLMGESTNHSLPPSNYPKLPYEIAINWRMQILSQVLELEQKISTETLAEQLKTDIQFIKDALLTLEKNLSLQRKNKEEDSFELDSHQKKQLQQTSLEIASHALESSNDQRDLFLTSTFIGTQREIEMIRREIVKLCKQLSGFSSQGKKEELFQFNVQFFSLR